MEITDTQAGFEQTVFTVYNQSFLLYCSSPQGEPGLSNTYSTKGQKGEPGLYGPPATSGGQGAKGNQGPAGQPGNNHMSQI